MYCIAKKRNEYDRWKQSTGQLIYLKLFNFGHRLIKGFMVKLILVYQTWVKWLSF